MPQMGPLPWTFILLSSVMIFLLFIVCLSSFPLSKSIPFSPTRPQLLQWKW